MKTIIQGKEITITYGVDYKWKRILNDKNQTVTVYTGKPELTKHETVKWKDIYKVDGEVAFNKKPKTFDWKVSIFNNIYENKLSIGSINLSESEEVDIEEKIYRADINATVLHVNKVMKEEELNKEEAEGILKSQVAAFSKVMIESDEKLLSYCKVHKINPSQTDVDELFKLVYPNTEYTIENGKIIPLVTLTSSIDITPIQYTHGIPPYAVDTGIGTSWIK